MDGVVAGALERAAEIGVRHAGRKEANARLGVRVTHVARPSGLSYQRYKPSLSFVLVGRKRSIIGEDDQVWGRERFLITPVDLPVVAGVVETDPQLGFVSVVCDLDPVLIADVATAMPTKALQRSPPDRLGTWTRDLADAVTRFLFLLDAPEEIPMLAQSIRREIVFRVLQTDQAPRLLAALDSGEGELVRRAISLLTEEIDEVWSSASIAARLHVGESTLVGKFKQVTGLTPMQFLKRNRLGEARRRMVLLGDSAAEAGARVGYRSTSHFSRDYRREYGGPPAADASRLRASLREAAI
ncbi:AraC family transcriptional regulator [Leifsonia sp. 22587]|uniref:AraC family transcriptional regulator n=1 Tax=Leifsonia sp. 22587 TaxID=3453946 RepID=UPI003F853E01